MRTRLSFAVALSALVVALLAVTACTTATAATQPRAAAPSATATLSQSTPGTVTPTGPVHLGAWMMAVHSVHAYQHHWNPPAGMPGMWDDIAAGHMAVVLDVSAQDLATPVTNPGGAALVPQCALHAGQGMMGPMMGSGTYGWTLVSPGLYRGPLAFMVPTATGQFTMVCADPATGSRATWTLGV